MKGGAGSTNVSLIKNKKQALSLINKAFGKGFSSFNRYEHFKERVRRFKSRQESFIGVLKGFARIFITNTYSKKISRDRNYVYFQDFIPNNEFDIRVVVIKDKAIAERRKVRAGDFRASGSGIFDYSNIDDKIIEIAFSIAEKMKVQSVAFDFLYKENTPLIIEISYAFGINGIIKSPGYWNRDLSFISGPFDPRIWMLIEFYF